MITLQAVDYHRVLPATFLHRISALPEPGYSQVTRYSLDQTRGIRFYLSQDGLSGFGITKDQELVNLFSPEHGRGHDAVQQAIAQGAEHLNCFDTWLVSFYKKHGFVEYRREANWTPGEPGIVYMRLAQVQAA